MVYGRYNSIVNGDYFIVHKPTNITGGPHPVVTMVYYIYYEGGAPVR